MIFSSMISNNITFNGYFYLLTRFYSNCEQHVLMMCEMNSLIDGLFYKTHSEWHLKLMSCCIALDVILMHLHIYVVRFSKPNRSLTRSLHTVPNTVTQNPHTQNVMTGDKKILLCLEWLWQIGRRYGRTSIFEMSRCRRKTSSWTWIFM